MGKVKVTVTLDKTLKRWAVRNHINLSGQLEDKILELMKRLDPEYHRQLDQERRNL